MGNVENLLGVVYNMSEVIDEIKKIASYDVNDEYEMLEKIRQNLLKIKDYMLNEETYETFFQYDYLKNMLSAFLYNAGIVFKERILFPTDKFYILAHNISLIYQSLYVQISEGSNVIAIDEFKLNEDGVKTVSYYDVFFEEYLEVSMNAKDRLSLMIPIIDDDVELIIKDEFGNIEYHKQLSKSKNFAYEILFYADREIQFAMAELSKIDLEIIQKMKFTARDISKAVDENLDTKKIGLIKTLSFKGYLGISYFVKTTIISILLYYRSKKSYCRAVRDYVLKIEASTLFYTLTMSFGKEKHKISDVCKAFLSEEAFLKYFTIQYLRYESLFDEIETGKFLIPLTTSYRNHNNVKSKIAAILADDLLLDAYYCDFDFEVNYILNKRRNLFDQPTLAKEDSLKIYNVIYNMLPDC